LHIDAVVVSVINKEAMRLFDLTVWRDAYSPTPTAEAIDDVRQRAD
jgi:hypothetical protein